MPQSHNPPNFFAGPYINRCSETREHAAALETIRTDPTTRYVLSVGGQQLLQATEAEASARSPSCRPKTPLCAMPKQATWSYWVDFRTLGAF